MPSDDYNVICDFTGFKYKRSECRKMWNGLIVRADLWEPRHPQDFVRVPVDDTRVKDARNEQPTQPIDTGNAYYDFTCYYNRMVSYDASMQYI